MNIITNIRHYVSTAPYSEDKNYKVGEIYTKNGYEYTIIKIEGEHMLIKGEVGQFCVNKNYNFDK